MRTLKENSGRDAWHNKHPLHRDLEVLQTVAPLYQLSGEPVSDRQQWSEHTTSTTSFYDAVWGLLDCTVCVYVVLWFPWLCQFIFSSVLWHLISTLFITFSHNAFISTWWTTLRITCDNTSMHSWLRGSKNNDDQLMVGNGTLNQFESTGN